MESLCQRCGRVTLCLILGAVVGCGARGTQSRADAGISFDAAVHDAGLDAGDEADAGETDAGGDEDAGAQPTDAGGETDAGTTMDGGTLDAGEPVLWDLAMIRDPSTAECTFTNHRVVTKNLSQFDEWDVTYKSWESVNGTLQPILIRAFAAKPRGVSGALPGIVQAHGLGGAASDDQPVSLSLLTGMFTIAYTGPGGGDANASPRTDSEGRAAGYDSGKRMFDTIPDVRGSWFWGHAVAAMRALTCLETRSDVDATRLGITGFSAGGVISLIVVGADDRVKAAVPLSGTHAWSVATQSPTAWQHALLTQAGYTTDSPEWQRLQEAIIDPSATVAHASGKVLMVDGSSDEFFPLTAFAATYDAIPGTDKRLSLAANFDHGCYQITGGESQQTIADRAVLHANGGQRMWFKHWFGTDSTYATVPATPTVSLSPAGGGTLVLVAVDPGQNGLSISHVNFWASGDNAQLFANAALDRQSDTLYGKIIPLTLPVNAVSFADVEYESSFGLEHFALSSTPAIPAGFVPQIRPINSCALQ